MQVYAVVLENFIERLVVLSNGQSLNKDLVCKIIENADEGILLSTSKDIRDWNELLEHCQLFMMLDVGEAIAEAALKRKESLGAHFREDTAGK